MRRKPKKPKKYMPPTTPPTPSPPSPPPPDDGEGRAEYYAVKVTLLNCTPGNFDHAEGEPASIVTVAREGLIEPLAMNMHDTRTLVTNLLVSLASNEDKFAAKLLDENFGANAEGDFEWPDPDRVW